MKSGIGSASIMLENGLAVGAIVAVNALGDVYEDGRIIAGMLEVAEGDGRLEPAESDNDSATADCSGSKPEPADSVGRQEPAESGDDSVTTESDGSHLFADSSRYLLTMGALSFSAAAMPLQGTNTTIGIVATNGTFTKAQCNKISAMAHNGMARAIRPVHTTMDGDLLFALSTGEIPGHVDIAGEMAAIAVERAIIKAVKAAAPAGGLPSWQSFHPAP
jgi:L-aminopeptidase/D-esterase-like protein